MLFFCGKDNYSYQYNQIFNKKGYRIKRNLTKIAYFGNLF